MPIPILGALAGGAVAGTIAKIVITFIIFRVIKLLGIVFITYFGITTVFDYITNQVQGHFHNIPGSLMDILQLCGVDVALGMYFSTTLGLATFKSLTSGFSIARASLLGNMSPL